MNRKNLLLIYIIVQLSLMICITSCNNANTQKSDDKTSANKPCEIDSTIKWKQVPDSCSVSIAQDEFNELVYPFSFWNCNAKELLASFKDEIQIDSIEYEDYPGYKYKIYRFCDGKSHIDFFIKTFNEIYLDKADINSNLIDFKNGVVMGITKEDFYQKMKLDYRNCDTLRIYVGDLSSDYDFIFSDNKLKRIIVWSTE